MVMYDQFAILLFLGNSLEGIYGFPVDDLYSFKLFELGYVYLADKSVQSDL